MTQDPEALQLMFDVDNERRRAEKAEAALIEICAAAGVDITLTPEKSVQAVRHEIKIFRAALENLGGVCTALRHELARRFNQTPGMSTTRACSGEETCWCDMCELRRLRLKLEKVEASEDRLKGVLHAQGLSDGAAYCARHERSWFVGIGLGLRDEKCPWCRREELEVEVAHALKEFERIKHFSLCERCGLVEKQKHEDLCKGCERVLAESSDEQAV